MIDLRTARTRRSAAVRFAGFCALVAHRLPVRVPPSLVGFCLISGTTFALDMLLLAFMYTVLGWPNGIALTIGYTIAFGLNFLLNRWLNFRSHAPLGPQAGRYVVAVAINYVAFILGVGGGLTALGVQYLLARLLAGMCEAVYMYSVMRWVIFPPRRSDPHPTAPQQQCGGAGAASTTRGRSRPPRPSAGHPQPPEPDGWASNSG